MQTVNSGTKVASGVALPSHITTRELNVRAGALTLAAAFLGWMFDGVEMGIFPLVARPALLELQAAGGGIGEQFVQTWMGRITAGFLFGAAAGGLVFGWLGDRIGRVHGCALIALAGIFADITLQSWRWVMLIGMLPALLAIFVRWFVPESDRWKKSVAREGASRPLLA